ncbi:hypothetical protein ACA106_15640 [Agrobacterium pusense]|uniref:hypothetical protein n=1 Tax=Agrobacterium pusense TaxID=648995 RepID=UPI0035A74359
MSKMRARYHELVAEQSKLRGESDRLINARSQALIEATAFSEGDKIRSLHDEIMAIDAAIMAADEQAKIEERRARASRDAQVIELQIDEVGRLCGKRDDEMAKAHAALEEATRALLTINTLSADIQKIVGPYSGSNLGYVGEIDSVSVGHRMSERIISTLSQLGVNGYGSLLWAPRPENPPARDWAAEERTLVDAALSYPLKQMKKKAEALEAEGHGEGPAE